MMIYIALFYLIVFYKSFFIILCRVIIVDEAHENSVPTETLLGLLRKILNVRPDLRIIISSATINAQKYYDFFDLSQEKNLKSNSKDSSQVLQEYFQPAVMSVEGR